MYSSLEARVPLLDHNIVEFAINIHRGLKTKNEIQKHILKELIYDYVPREIMKRPKWGFSIPLEKWLKTDLNYLIENYLNKEIITEQGIFNYNEIEQLKLNFKQGSDYLYNRLWCLILITKFLANLNQH